MASKPINYECLCIINQPTVSSLIPVISKNCTDNFERTDHFHVHVTHISNGAFLGSTTGQAHLLDEIIDNIQLYPDYYSNKTFIYSLGVEHALYSRFELDPIFSKEVAVVS